MDEESPLINPKDITVQPPTVLKETEDNSRYGSYHAPYLLGNPHPGKHTIEVNPSIASPLAQMIREKVILITGPDFDPTMKAFATAYAAQADQLIADLTRPDSVELQKQMILKHEQTHQMQEIRFNYRDLEQRALDFINSDTLSEGDNTKLFNDLQEAQLFREVQALLSGYDVAPGDKDDMLPKIVETDVTLHLLDSFHMLYDGYTDLEGLFSSVNSGFVNVYEDPFVAPLLAKVMILTGDLSLFRELHNDHFETQPVIDKVKDRLTNSDPTHLLQTIRDPRFQLQVDLRIMNAIERIKSQIA